MYNVYIEIVVISLIVLMIFYGFLFTIVIFMPRHKRKIVEKKDFVHYFFIPCLNEEVVIENSIKFWDKYSKLSDIKIVLINDASEDDTKKIIVDYIADKDNFILIDRQKPNAQLGKGAALNQAYNVVRQECRDKGYDSEDVIITIFDADAQVKDEFLFELENAMSHDDVALTQSRISIINTETWIGLMQEIEFYTIIDGIQNFRSHIGSVAAGGNGQSILLSAIEDNDEPWGNALLEDYEFSLRLLLKGYKTKYIYKEATYQEGVTNYKAYVKQRGRWAQGGIQCIKYQMEIIKSRNLSFISKLEYLFFMYLPYVSIIGIISYLILITKNSLMFYNTYEQVIFFQTFYIILLIVSFIPGIVITVKYSIQKHRKIKARVLTVGISQYFYNWVQVPAQVNAIYRNRMKKDSWVKTARIGKK